MNNPKISVIIPVYNVEQYLSEAIDSVLCQTFTGFEIILVDDGSTDACGIICDEYASIDSHIRVIHKSNGGLSSARNAGIEIAQGQYIMFLDSDDLFSSRTLFETLLSLFDNNADIDFIQFQSKNFKTEPERPECFDNIQTERINDLDSIFYAYNKWKFTHTCCNKIYNSSAIKSTRFPINLYYEDEHFTCSMLPKLHSILLTNIMGYCVRERAGSITRPTSFNNKLFYDHVIVYSKLISIGKVHGQNDFIRTYYNAALINYKAAIIHGWKDKTTISLMSQIYKHNAVSIKYLIQKKAPIKEALTIFMIKLFGLRILNPFLRLIHHK